MCTIMTMWKWRPTYPTLLSVFDIAVNPVYSASFTPLWLRATFFSNGSRSHDGGCTKKVEDCPTNLLRATHELCTAENYAYKSAHISSFFRRPPHRRRPTFYTGLSEKLWDVIKLCVSLSPRVLCYNAAPVAVLLTRHSQFRSLRRSHDCIKFQPSGRTPHNHHSIVTRFLFTKCLENQTVSTLLS